MHVLRTALQFWKETWTTDKPLFITEMTGTLCGMTAAAIMGFQSPEPNLLFVFSFYLISSVCFIYSNYVRESAWLLILMIFYLITTAIGLIRVL